MAFIDRRRRRPPVMYLLFLIGYLALVLLIQSQDRTISNQRQLIAALYNDSSQLSVMKAEAASKR
jgi:Tfp pilus assembly protein PilN